MTTKSPTFPFSKLEEIPSEELIAQELVSYVLKNGKLVKHIVKRKFFHDSYIDTCNEEVLLPYVRLPTDI